MQHHTVTLKSMASCGTERFLQLVLSVHQPQKGELELLLSTYLLFALPGFLTFVFFDYLVFLSQKYCNVYQGNLHLLRRKYDFRVITLQMLAIQVCCPPPQLHLSILLYLRS